MSNPVKTNIDLGNLVLQSPIFEDGIVTFSGAATLKEGTILARDSVSSLFVPFVKGGTTNENGIPKAILTYELTDAGAGEEYARVGCKW